MPRFRLLIEYDGTPFRGWQFQPGAPTVQGVLAEAVLRTTGEVVQVAGAGRTDAGVHAAGQVGHVDLARRWNPGRLRDALNAHLRPWPVAVLAAEEALAGFDARFSATGRRYRYAILNRRGPPALLAQRVWHVMKPLDADRMHQAAQSLVGHHDFTTFRNADCQAKSPMRTLRRLAAWREGDTVVIEAEARSFLHNQVRSMAGSLKRVGEGAWNEADLVRALEARDRAACAAVAPPCGLTLVSVGYDGGAAVLPAGDDDGADG